MLQSGFMKRSGIMMMAVLLLAGGAGRANAWWDAKWQFREKISFNTTDKGAAIKENVSDVPVLVRLHEGNFVFDNAKEDGSDIRFMAADDKMALKFHIESFDTKKRIALVWVRVPQISGGAASDSIWLYYGNKSVQAGQDAVGTYDTAQSLVFHLAEADGTPKDSAGFANHASEFSGKLGAAAAIGNGASFPGAGSKLVVKRAPSLKFDKGFTFSTWLKLPQAQSDARLFSWDDGAQSIVVGIAGARAYAKVSSGKASDQASGSADIPLQSWHHLAVTAEPGKKLSIYLDGREAGSSALGAAMPSPASELAFGASISGTQPFIGEIDELQLSAIPRSAAWLAVQAGSQGQDGKLITTSPEESGKSGGSSETIHMLRVVAGTVTLDAWVIISLCTFMLCLAIGVFINKFMYLQKIIASNKDFSDEFEGINDPISIDAEADEHEDSGLFRVYRAGHREIQRLKLRQADSGNGKLSRAAISIFETALDRASVREAQQMNAWMIVLTLGISGGPFWGLLGTVWGVMNTFAGLAEAGEANLSAIAPGVASALACTLFGLLVAIPALFAYSYLINRMKKVGQDTRLFIDEFTGKIEEAYGDNE